MHTTFKFNDLYCRLHLILARYQNDVAVANILDHSPHPSRTVNICVSIGMLFLHHHCCYHSLVHGCHLVSSALYLLVNFYLVVCV